MNRIPVPPPSVRALVALTVLLSVLSCSEGREDGPYPGAEPPRSVVRFRAAEALTRAGSGDSAVSSLDLLVFRAADGRLDAASRAEGGDGVSASVSRGVPLRWHLIANIPEGRLSGVSREDGLSGTHLLLSDCTPGALPMHASGTITVTGDGAAVEAALERYVCKVSVNSLELSWPEASGTAPQAALGTVALINAVGSVPVTGIPSAGPLWYNRLEADPDLPDSVRPLLTADGSLPAVMYAMPNPTDNAVDSASEPLWSPRNTRVALGVRIDGILNWYRVTLPAMRGNTHYVIDRLTVLGPGAPGPDYPAERNAVGFEMSIEPWTEGTEEAVFE